MDDAFELVFKESSSKIYIAKTNGKELIASVLL